MKRLLTLYVMGLAAVSSAGAQKRALVEIPPDHSLVAEQYVARGLPDPAREWGAGELADALRLLDELAAEDPTLLPRFGSDRSGAVFDRILVESLTFGSLGDEVSSSPLPAYDFVPAAGLLFDRERVEIQRAVAAASLRVVEESAGAGREVDGWLTEAGGRGREGSAEQLRGLAASQLRIRDAYETRLLTAAEGLAGLCERETASLQARTEARTHAEAVLARAVPLLSEQAAGSAQALLDRLRGSPGCDVPASAAP